MILAIDIGNTNIVIGGFEGESLNFVARLSTDPRKTDSEYAATIKSVIALKSEKTAYVRGAIISSVVPQITHGLKSAVKMVYGVESLIVGPGVKTGINLLVDNPSQVGADLICACVAAYNMYEPPVLITDMGTATKMIVVDEHAAFKGVSIIPGVELSLKALAGGTAQLPQISLEAPKTVIAKNTVECMKSGVVFGNAALVDGMVDRIFDELKTKATLVATGGLARIVIPHCRHKITIDDNLLLNGLYIIYKKNCPQEN